MIYVISTLSNDNEYCVYDKARKQEGINVVVKKILIKGGANVQNKRTLQVSSQGVTTPVTEADFADLEQNPVFKMQCEKGFIRYIKTNEADARRKAEKMDLKDKSAQLIAQDYEKRGMKTPKVSVEEIESSK